MAPFSAGAIVKKKMCLQQAASPTPGSLGSCFEVLELLRPPPEPQLVPDSSLAVYVRQTAIHANVACTSLHRSQAGSSYVNNWHERLQHLERLRGRLERNTEPPPDDLADL
ncbi:hypothetical protein HPB51_012938 [Rhipicephalus microplus]|uniref:Uncharacterized protein n=1 Tax=Rhipicephalus microplus TaxID=6941 RepID=A0A9J6F3V1_RHIMP|nr:hypothetical protein HPB51_012938 [Rhipicephalus microplus]